MASLLIGVVLACFGAILLFIASLVVGSRVVERLDERLLAREAAVVARREALVDRLLAGDLDLAE